MLAMFVSASSAAFAADLPIRPYTKAPPPAASGWTGFYAGANAGYGWQDPTVVFPPADPFAGVMINGVGGVIFAPVQPPTSFDIAGATGGFQAGYNRQINQRWLLGVETDFNFSGMTGQGAAAFISGAPFPASAFGSEQV